MNCLYKIGGGTRSSHVGSNPASRITVLSLLVVIAVIAFSVLISTDSGAEVSSGATGSSINDGGKYGDSGSASLVSVPGLDENRGDVATTSATSPFPFKQIEVGLAHACVVDASGGKISCWGEDSASGQVTGWNIPYAGWDFQHPSPQAAIFTCGTKTNGDALCWGYPTKEDGTHRETTNMTTYAAWVVRPDYSVDNPNDDKTGYTGWVDAPLTTDNVKFKPGTVSVGNYHACGIKTNGEATCWGKGGSDRLLVPKDSGGQVYYRLGATRGRLGAKLWCSRWRVSSLLGTIIVRPGRRTYRQRFLSNGNDFDIQRLRAGNQRFG